MRFFNTEGPVRADDHYTLPPLSRIDLDEVTGLIAQKKYFLLYAARQTGKTSCLLALVEHLNRGTEYHAVYVNIEAAQALREDVDRAMGVIVGELGRRVDATLGGLKAEVMAQEVLATGEPGRAVATFLARLCAMLDRPLVLMLDEVDALIGDTLLSLLRQLRSGYPDRPKSFPQTVILCGVRDLHDYRIQASSEKAAITSGSAFNINAKSLRLGDFSRADVETLLGEHTRETGQLFVPDAVERVWELTEGQPWLVNALAYEVTWEMKAGRDRSRPIERAAIEQAKENLIQRRVTHLDQLAHKLEEPRVRHIIEPMLAGTSMGPVPDDDIQFVVDLGLCRLRNGSELRVANPIYREVLPRVLASTPQATLPRLTPSWLLPNGDLDAPKLLESFLAFWRQHGEPLLRSASYHEIAPHLVLMAFLHRVANGEGTLEREYAIGMGRMDLCLRYRALTLGLELKVWRDGAKEPLRDGLEQLDEYLAGLGVDFGWLVIFDQRSGLPPMSERTSASEVPSPKGRRITVVRA